MIKMEKQQGDGSGGLLPELAALEPGQLASAKPRFPRRSLKGPQILLLWSLRLYLLFMLAVVIYQAWTGA
ncbi:MAG TPA: hypothetical protein VI636_23840 [Candidatus Angelobacter sp.]